VTPNIAFSLAAALGAGICDLWTGRIPNGLTYAAIAVGLVLGCVSNPETALWGGASAAAVALLLYTVGSLGGGDAKLIVALGTLLGASRMIEIVMIAIALSVLPAMVLVLRAGLFRSLVAHLRLAVMNCTATGAARMRFEPSLRLRFGPILAASTVLVVCIPSLQFLS